MHCARHLDLGGMREPKGLSLMILFGMHIYRYLHVLYLILLIPFDHSTLQAHLKSACWRTTSFPLYDKMYYLVNGIVATGADVFHPGWSPAVVSSDDDHSNSSGTGTNLNLEMLNPLPSSSVMLFPIKS